MMMIIIILVERRVDVNIRNAINDTALHLAALLGGVEIIKILLDKGISVDLRNGDDSTPQHVSATYDNLEATKVLSKEVLL